EVSGRSALVQPVGKQANPGTSDDALLLSGFLVGATAALHLGERFPVSFRLGAGALIGSFRDERQGSFTSATGARYQTDPLSVSPTTTFFYLDPEIRFGVRPVSHLELSVGVDALVLLALSRPQWDDHIEVAAGSDGIGTYRADTLVGTPVVALTPSLGA